MTSGQFRLCLETLRWPQWKVAHLLGITPLKMRKWSCGAEIIPEPVAVWIRALSAEMDAVYARHLPPAVPRKAQSSPTRNAGHGREHGPALPG
jgi:hypothetical protein